MMIIQKTHGRNLMMARMTAKERDELLKEAIRKMEILNLKMDVAEAAEKARKEKRDAPDTR
jgi:hypothetical protein